MSKLEAVFAGGCFWCIEAAFDNVEGVLDLKPGYIGGNTSNPTYNDVSSGITGHLEAVKIWYNDEKISYVKLLSIFFQNINPTDSSGQFADRGTQYEGAIFYTNETQKKLASEFINLLDRSQIFDSPVAVKLISATEFFEAEQYHHRYYNSNKIHYKTYKQFSGRGPFLEKIWTKENIEKINDIVYGLENKKEI